MVRISAITLDTFLELVGGQVIHELREDCLTGIHSSLSEMRADGRLSAATPIAAANSNRNIQVASYRFNYLLDIPGQPDFSRTLY